MKRLVENGNAQPLTWNFTSRQVESDTGRMEGTVTMRGGEGTATLEFVQVNSAWKVIAFDLEEK